MPLTRSSPVGVWSPFTSLMRVPSWYVYCFHVVGQAPAFAPAYATVADAGEASMPSPVRSSAPARTAAQTSSKKPLRAYCAESDTLRSVPERSRDTTRDSTAPIEKDPV